MTHAVVCCDAQSSAVREDKQALEATQSDIASLESTRDELRQRAAQANRDAAAAAAAVESAAIRLTEGEERRASSARALEETAQEIADAQRKIAQSQQVLERSAQTIASVADDRARLEMQRDERRADLSRVLAQASEDRAAAQDMSMRYESRRSSRESAEQSLARMQSQLEQYHQRQNALQHEMSKAEAPVAHMQKTVEEQLGGRVEIEAELGEARRRVENTEAQLRNFEQQRSDHEQAVSEARDALGEARLAGQETRVRQEGLLEQFQTTGFEIALIQSEMPEEATAEGWAEGLEKLQRKIERLGPINLAAIDEFKEQAERKEYLDAQLADLNAALTTLENAIRKSDRETRNRFKETYDQVNSGFQRVFPKLFGGGQAYLELTGDDMLAAGVTVMARPPGKRNSTIHLLSGGEKALTAVALVFAIFELNPAPFCMLDEVDAPLDDANVGRYARMVKEMSEKVQFVFITHNKI